jgi:hypothetical protein
MNRGNLEHYDYVLDWLAAFASLPGVPSPGNVYLPRFAFVQAGLGGVR